MNKELYGVFGDREEFRSRRSVTEFDRVVEGDTVTVGVRDVGLGIPGRTAVHEDETGFCVVWGEAFPPAGVATNSARWLLDRYAEMGTDALAELNGSYLALVEHDDAALVATDPARTRECFYTDDGDVRVFGTDPVAVGKTIRDPRLDPDALFEFVHLSVVLGERTPLTALERVPFDGYLTETATGRLARFVYEPREFDYVDELARRLTRAIRRRAILPGRKGLLLSGGYDSRLFLATLPEIEECYTLGTPASQEVDVAKRIAAQYGTDHRTLVADGRYLNVHPSLTRYGLGIKESLHIHHGGYDSEMNVDAIYHGLLFDTFLSGHFLPTDAVTLFDRRFPRNRLEPDPDPVSSLLDSFAFLPASRELFATFDTTPDEGIDRLRSALEARFDDLADRSRSVYNAIDAVGIENQPSTSFRTHLADTYVESFVAADAELLDWHLTTPPEHRNTRTLLAAMRRIDPDVLRHRPPDRPHDSRQRNQFEKFVRELVPGLTPFDSPWPDRTTLYERANLDETLFPDRLDGLDLPVRLKLRVNDATQWLDAVLDDPSLSTYEVLYPVGRSDECWTRTDPPDGGPADGHSVASRRFGSLDAGRSGRIENPGDAPGWDE